MKNLIICEKPSLAKNVCNGLALNGESFKRVETYYESNKYIVTSVFGHLFGLYDIDDYKDSAELISDYKKSEDKSEFKRNNYSRFKKYDLAKRNLAYLKKHLNINSPEELKEYVKRLLEERNVLYKSYTETVQKEKDITTKRKKTTSL